MRRQLACNENHVLAQTVLDLSSCVHIQQAQPLIALVRSDVASVLVTELAWMVPAHRHGSCIEFPREFYGGTSYMLFASRAIHNNNNTAIHSVRSSWTSIRMPPQMVLPIHPCLYHPCLYHPRLYHSPSPTKPSSTRCIRVKFGLRNVTLQIDTLRLQSPTSGTSHWSLNLRETFHPPVRRRFLYLGLHRGLVFITISTHPLLMIQVMVMYL